MKTNPNDPSQAVRDPYIKDFYIGLTKREHFAAMAMQGFAHAQQVNCSGPAISWCKYAVQWADALIAALNKKS